MFLKFDDADLFITSHGQGRPLVVHGGWVGSGEVWQLSLGQLSRRWRTVAYDHRGTGATINRAETITFEMLVDDLFRVLDAEDIDQCVLAGESSGACVVLEAALRHPERFTGLVIVDGLYHGGRSAGAARFRAGCITDFAATMHLFVDACIPEEDAEAERRWGRQIVSRSDGRSAVQLMECLEAVDIEPRLGQITQPTLILHGSRDRITPVDTARNLADKLTGSVRTKLHIIEGAGHVPTLTRPREVADAIDVFFSND